jgi:8-oxo-dGTP diphosphatase
MKLLAILEDKTKVSLAVVKCDGKYLLGLSTATDERKNTWCFPGGHLHKGEDPKKGAEREAKEETKVNCHVVKGPIFPAGLQHIACFLCKASTPTGVKPNREFSNLGWFTVRELKGLKLYKNVREILQKLGEIS